MILASVIAIAGWGAADAENRDMLGTQVILRMVGAELEMFHDDWGRFPTTSEGLSILAAPGKDGEPYFGKPGFTRDKWGAAFVYRCPARTLGRPYDLYSLGPNGIDESGHGDDVNCWPPASAPSN